MQSDFVKRQLALVHLYAEGSAGNPIAGPSKTEVDVVARRQSIDRVTSPSKQLISKLRAIAARQAIGDPPKSANDNSPKPSAARVRKSSGKSVRGAFADSLPMLMALRNTPDHRPEPIRSSWSTDASATISEPDRDETGKKLPSLAVDMLLEITPSIAKIRYAFEKGDVFRGKPQANKRTKKIAKRGPIIAIGKEVKRGSVTNIIGLHFSDGSQTERATRVREGKVEAFDRPMPIGAMLGTSEKLSPHIGTDAAASLSNTRLCAVFFRKDEHGRPNNWRPFTPGGTMRRGRSYKPDQSRKLIDRAIANTRVMPPIKYCPPGIASGTARFADQFVGVVSSLSGTGKGGAVGWVDVHSAVQSAKEWKATIKSADPNALAVLRAALTAKNLGEVGAAAGQSEKYATYAGGGKLALKAANDNFAATARALAA